MKNEYFIRSKGKAEVKTFHLINIDTFDMLDSFFNSEIGALEFATKHSLKIVEYKETFEKIENGK